MSDKHIERIFVCLRQIDQVTKKSPENIQFNISDLMFSFPLKAAAYLLMIPFKLFQSLTGNISRFAVKASKYTFSSFRRDAARILKTTYTISRFAIAVFFSSFFICASISVNMAVGSYNGLLFWLFVIAYLIISFFVSFFVSFTTTKFLKIQGNNIEEMSVLGEISERVNLAEKLRENALAVKNYQKCAIVVLKEKIDSLNDLANLANILSSMGVVLVALSFFINWSENDFVRKNRTVDHETIAKIFAGIIFFCFFTIRTYLYVRLQKLRRWLTVLELGSIMMD